MREDILQALSELIKEKTELKAEKIKLGIADDVEKLTQQAKDLIPDLTRDVNAIKESEKNVDKQNKLLNKRKSVLEKSDTKERELSKAYERARDDKKTAEREFKETEKTLETNKKNIDFYNKRLNKTKAKASKTKTNLEKKLNALQKAAKELGVKIPTGEASKVLKKLITLL
jgi:septal ring factor EnvC (AmiA/AmiB activator)